MAIKLTADELISKITKYGFQNYAFLAKSRKMQKVVINGIFICNMDWSDGLLAQFFQILNHNI
jgi:hypothetical protein